MGSLCCKEDPAEKDAKILHKAMRGFGTNEEAIIKIVAHRTNEQRQLIRNKFKALYRKDLVNELKSELSGNFKECCIALFMHPGLYDAHWLHKALSGFRTDKAMLIEIMCTRRNSQMRDIREHYTSKFDRDLEEDLKKSTSGDFKDLLTNLSQGNRDETTEVDYDRAQVEAKELYEAGKKRLGSYESKFNEIITQRSVPQLRATFDEYDKISKDDILQKIDHEMSGDLHDGLKAIVVCVRNSGDFFAEKLYKSMKGLGTDDDTLIRIIVSRSEIDLPEIKSSFHAKYNKSLSMYVDDDTSGDYRRLLDEIIGREE